MAFHDIWQGAKRFFGPDNPFFHGPQEEQPQQPAAEQSAPQPEAPAPEQPAYPQGQPYPQQAYSQPYPQPQAAYQNPYQPPQPQPQQGYQPQPQVQNAQQSPFQQGYRPPQPQQNVNDPYVAPRNRRSQQHQQPAQPQPQPQTDMNGNVVPFPGMQPQGAAPAPKSANACVINVRSIADCRNAIGILRSSDCVLAVMDSIADQAEVRRYVDTLNGACFSLGCTMTRLSARVGVYLLAPAGMNVYTDQATTQMNSQSRAPQRPQAQRPQQPQQAFRPPYQQPQQPAYQQAPQQPYGQMQQAYQQPQSAPVFSAQSPAQGYTPDVNEAEYNAI